MSNKNKTLKNTIFLFFLPRLKFRCSSSPDHMSRRKEEVRFMHACNVRMQGGEGLS